MSQYYVNILPFLVATLPFTNNFISSLIINYSQNLWFNFLCNDYLFYYLINDKGVLVLSWNIFPIFLVTTVTSFSYSNEGQTSYINQTSSNNVTWRRLTKQNPRLSSSCELVLNTPTCFGSN